MRGQDIRIAVTSPANGDQRYLNFEIGYSYRDRLKAQQTVRALVSRFADSNMTGPNHRVARLDVVDPPSLPVAPASPKRGIFAATGFGMGLVAAMVLRCSGEDHRPYRSLHNRREAGEDFTCRRRR